MKLQRKHWILLGLFVFLTYQIVSYIWSHWGLITIHSKDTPLSQIIRSIEKQGHVTIKSNLDPNKPVYMNVENVYLNEAMETLATVTDARWRLTYVVGPDKGAVNNVLTSFESGQRDEAWKHLYVPLGGFGDHGVLLPDPRKDTWTVKPASEATLQSYLEEASKNVSASFWVPETWNPAVKSPPSSGTISKSFSKLASASNSKYVEVIMLQGSTRTSERSDRGDRGERGEGEPRFAGNFGGGDRRGFDRSAMDERIQNEINKLTGADRAAAEAERNQRKQMLESMKDLTPEQRAQRFADMMQSSDMQDKMENQQNQQQNRNSPQQRISRGGGYMSRMAAAASARGK